MIVTRTPLLRILRYCWIHPGSRSAPIGGDEDTTTNLGQEKTGTIPAGGDTRPPDIPARQTCVAAVNKRLVVSNRSPPIVETEKVSCVRSQGEEIIPIIGTARRSQRDSAPVRGEQRECNGIIITYPRNRSVVQRHRIPVQTAILELPQSGTVEGSHGSKRDPFIQTK